MSYWIELHCDALELGCETHKGENHMDGATNTISAINKSVRSIREAARKSGWKLTSKGWVCPNCQQVATQQEKES